MEGGARDKHEASQKGAVLIQKQVVETPLAYSSRLLKMSELNYTITEKECLSAVWAIKKFQYLIWIIRSMLVA